MLKVCQMDFPIEIWYTIFERLNMSDIIQVSNHLYNITKNYTGYLCIDDIRYLKNRNWSIFIYRWLNTQTKLDLFPIKVTDRDLIKIIDQFSKINTIIVKDIINKRKFIASLFEYANADPLYYQKRQLIIETEKRDDDKTLQTHDTHLEQYHNRKKKNLRKKQREQYHSSIPHLNIYHWFSPEQQCHRCFKEVDDINKLVPCYFCKTKCCDDCYFTKISGTRSIQDMDICHECE